MACRQGSILALRWRDKHDIIVLSTKHTPAMTTSFSENAKRFRFEGEVHGCRRLQAHGRH